MFANWILGSVKLPPYATTIALFTIASPSELTHKRDSTTDF